MKHPEVRLTRREAQVAALVANGSSAKDIAKRLGIAPKTVDGYIEDIAKRVPGLGRPRHRITLFFLLLNPPDNPHE